MERKRILSICLCAALAFTSIFAGMTFAADEDKAAAAALEKELREVNKKLADTQKLLKSGKQKDKELTSEINAIEKNIQNAETQIGKLNANIRNTEGQITRKTQELQVKQAEIDERKGTMHERLRVMYKNSDLGLLQILLGSSSFTDLLTNMDVVQRIYQHDLDMIDFMKTDYAALNTEKVKLQNLKASLATQKLAVGEKQNALEEDKQEFATLRQEVRQDNSELAKDIDSFNDDANALTSQIAELMSKDEAYAGGGMAWPSPGYKKITSPFGNRMHPILKVNKMHTGVDISVPKGNKIVAANAGTVIMAAWYGGYGNAVIIDHGGGIATLYGHNTSLKVKKGDKVTKGQQVAVSGSTGRSTGPHLHFEVRVDGKYKDPMGYIK